MAKDRKLVSRRDFLVASGAVLATGALTACTQNSANTKLAQQNADIQGAVSLSVHNPRGELAPVEAKGLVNPRITTLEGKKIGLYAIKSWSAPWIEKVLKAKDPTTTFVALTTDTVKEVDTFIAATGD